MYVDDEDTSTSTTEDNEDVETVKTASTAKKDSQGTSLHQASETEDASLGDDDEEDIDQYFNDLFPGNSFIHEASDKILIDAFQFRSKSSRHSGGSD